MSEMIIDLGNVSMEGEVGGGTTEQYDDQLAEKEEHVCHAEKDVGKKGSDNRCVFFKFL